MEILEQWYRSEDSEFYLFIALLLFTLWFIRNTIAYYHAEKRKVKQLHRFAKKGDIEAQTDLALRYRKGKAVKKSCQNAAFWYQKAAFLGDENARGFLEEFLEKHKNNKKKRYS
jgi:TPR repeat protein